MKKRMGMLRSQGDTGKLRPEPGCPNEVTQRGLAAVGRRSPRCCQGNGPAPGEAQPALAWHCCIASRSELRRKDSEAQPRSGMEPRSGTRLLRVRGTDSARTV